MAHMPPQGFQERLVRHRQVFVTPAKENNATSDVYLTRNLCREAGFTDARLTQDKKPTHTVTLAVGDHACGQLQLPAPTDERSCRLNRQLKRKGKRGPIGLGLPDHLAHRNWLGQTLQL